MPTDNDDEAARLRARLERAREAAVALYNLPTTAREEGLGEAERDAAEGRLWRQLLAALGASET